MSDPRSELVAATRLLLEWGRARQATWHDPSRDLLAALGDRHASFGDFGDERPHETPPLSQVVDSPPRVSTEPPRMEAPAVVDTPAGMPSTAETSSRSHEARPSNQRSTDPPAPAAPRDPAPWPSIPAPVPTSSSRGRQLLRARWAFAAAAVLAVVAAPAVWRVYQSSSRPAAPQPSRVVIDSNPPGSTVLVNNVERGKTPLAIELPAGQYRVELRHRKNVRAFDLEVVAGMPAEATVDWTKRPATRRKGAPERETEKRPEKRPEKTPAKTTAPRSDTKMTQVATEPTVTAKAEPQRPAAAEVDGPEAASPEPAVAPDAETPRATTPEATTPDRP